MAVKKAKTDPAHDATERLLAEMEQKIAKEYSQAERELSAKIADYFRRFELKDQRWREWVKDGDKTKEEYQAWRVGQMAVGKRWESMKETIAQDLHHANDVARSIAYGYMPDVYAENFNYGTYEAEVGAKVDTSFTLYDKQTVERLMRDDPKLLPDPGKKKRAEIAAGQDILWNKQQVQSVMMQGILQGESIPKLANRLAVEVGEKDHRAAIRNARTMTTGAQNAGRVDSYKRAEDMGIKMVQEWRATLDMRTRHEHRVLDGQTQKVGDPFEVDGMEIMFPGDPSAEPALIYNCRCTLRAVVVGLEPQARKYRDESAIDGMTYEEWKESKVEKPEPITLQEEKGEAIRQAYLAEYRRGGRRGDDDEDYDVDRDDLQAEEAPAEETPAKDKPNDEERIQKALDKIEEIDSETSEDIKYDHQLSDGEIVNPLSPAELDDDFWELLGEIYDRMSEEFPESHDYGQAEMIKRSKVKTVSFSDVSSLQLSVNKEYMQGLVQKGTEELLIEKGYSGTGEILAVKYHEKYWVMDGNHRVAAIKLFGEETVDLPVYDLDEKDERVAVNGSDITATWTRRADQFDFEIEDVINAQGFDGLPKIVSAEEFDEAVKAANGGDGLIAQRVYSAPNQETLDSYKEQLYGGKWYLDCSGGAAFGNGMYATASYGNSISENVQKANELYEKRFDNPAVRTETMTMAEDTKYVDYMELTQKYRDYLLSKNYTEENKLTDLGSFAASIGYDAIKVNGLGFYETNEIVILNRTKVIIKGD